VNTAPLSVSTEAGMPCRAAALPKLTTTSAALVVARASEATSNREWSSMMFKMSTTLPPARTQWVMSACHRSLG
jgi:hypothetical protein